MEMTVAGAIGIAATRAGAGAQVGTCTGGVNGDDESGSGDGPAMVDGTERRKERVVSIYFVFAVETAPTEGPFLPDSMLLKGTCVLKAFIAPTGTFILSVGFWVGSIRLYSVFKVNDDGFGFSVKNVGDSEGEVMY